VLIYNVVYISDCFVVSSLILLTLVIVISVDRQLPLFAGTLQQVVRFAVVDTAAVIWQKEVSASKQIFGKLRKT